jgi:hypothetical protein
MKTSFFSKPAFAFLLLLAGVGLASCGLNRPAPEKTPTMNVTQALQTVEERLTQAIALTPSPAATTPAPTPKPSVAGPTPVPTTAASLTPGQVASCNKVAPGNPIDVTIDDDTPMQPGEKFTKTWRLVNDGTCTCSREYHAVWFFGDKFGDVVSVPLSGNVPPNGVSEVSVDMTAPTKPGTYRSNWKLGDASGALFGIGPNGDLPFWVQIVVVETGSPTATETATPTIPKVTVTPTPTLTPTQAAKVSGSADLIPGDRIDLDTNEINPASGDDLSYEIDASSSNHWMAGQNGGVMGLFGMGEPTLPVCKIATMSAAPIAVENLTPGTYLCYKTDQGSFGWLRYDAYTSTDASIKITFFTWTNP